MNTWTYISNLSNIIISAGWKASPVETQRAGLQQIKITPWFVGVIWLQSLKLPFWNDCFKPLARLWR